jgi:GNAT superfamily N-acetyltransferase
MEGNAVSDVYLEERMEAAVRAIRDDIPGLTSFECWFGPAHDLVVASLRVRKEERGKGRGTEAMQRLLAWADEWDLTVSLTPEPDDERRRKALYRFYRRLGFERNGRRRYDPTVNGTWFRPPACGYKRKRPRSPAGNGQEGEGMRTRQAIGALIVGCWTCAALAAPPKAPVLRGVVSDDSDPVGISTVKVEHEDGSVSTTTMTTVPLSACSDAWDCRRWVMDACGMNGRDADTYSYGGDGFGGKECLGTCKGPGKMTVEHVCPMKLSHRQTAIPIVVE